MAGGPGPHRGAERQGQAGAGRLSARPMSSLLAQLQALEVELHHPGVACDRARLEELLHGDFHEVGRSGRRYDRATVLRFLSERAVPPEVVSDAFAVMQPVPGVAMLTYRSAHRRPEGGLE